MTKIFWLFTLCLLSCGGPQKGKNPVQGINTNQNTEKQKIQEPELVFEFPIKKGNPFETVNKDNWDYPAELQIDGNSLYLLSSYERKIIRYDIVSKQFTHFEKIHEIMSHQKADLSDDIISPVFLRITNEHIVIGYGFRLLVFSKNEDLVYKMSFETVLKYISFNDDDKLNLWFSDSVIVLNLNNREERQTIPYAKTLTGENVNLVDLIVGDKEISWDDKVMTLEGKKTRIEQLNYPTKISSATVAKENYSLNCITPSYYVWYPWTMGSKLVLINKNDKSERIMDLGIDFSKATLANMEDRSNGLKIAGGDNTLYFMIMTHEKSEKIIKVYKLNIK